MNEKTPDPKPGAGRPRASSEAAREERLAAALRANLQRRKAQARARASGDETGPEAEGNE